MNNSASEAARQYRVRTTNDAIVLIDRHNPERTAEVRNTHVDFTIEARIVRACRSLVPGGLERWLELEIVDLRLGSENDLSDLSSLGEYSAEDGIFGIDGEDLSSLEITYARVIDLAARDRYGYPYIDRSKPSGTTGQDSERDERALHAGDESDSPVAELWYQTREDDSGYFLSALILTVGFPEPQFNKLIDACTSGRADTLVLECGCYAKSTGWASQSARDLILSSGDALKLPIEEAVISGPIAAPTSLTAIEAIADDVDDHTDHSEPYHNRQLSSTPAGGAASYTLLATTIAICILSALLGADPITLLTIAVLGVALAVLSTLRPIGLAIVERLAALSTPDQQKRRSL